MFCSRSVVDCLPHLPGRGTQQIHPNALLGHDRRDLWLASIGLHHEAQMGHDRMDDFLHPRHSCVLLFPAFVFFLEDGQFLVGSNACCLGRIRKEYAGCLQFTFCPTEHIYNSAELASHSSTLSPINVLPRFGAKCLICPQ